MVCFSIFVKSLWVKEGIYSETLTDVPQFARMGRIEGGDVKMIEIQIIGIRKPGGVYNDHTAISHYQWRDGNGQVAIWDRMKMVNWLLENYQEHKAYVKDSNGDKAYCKVMKSLAGTLFLETRPDGTIADNLLSLPQI